MNILKKNGLIFHIKTLSISKLENTKNLGNHVGEIS